MIYQLRHTLSLRQNKHLRVSDIVQFQSSSPTLIVIITKPNSLKVDNY